MFGWRVTSALHMIIIISVGRVSTERGALQCGAVCGMADDAAVGLAACNINRAAAAETERQWQSE